MDSNRGFGSQDVQWGVVVRKERYLFYFLGEVGGDTNEGDKGKNDEDRDY